MNREEVLGLLKETLRSCEEFYVTGIMLMLSSADVVQSDGYQLHIQINVDTQTLVGIENIAKKYGLTVYNKPNGGLIVIYKPLPANR